MKPPYEVGDSVRPSASFLLWQRKKNWHKLTADSVGCVRGFRAPVNVNGALVGQVIVGWPVEPSVPEGLYVSLKMRWDQIEPL